MKYIIQAENLKKYFKEVRAVDDISFCVERGELFGFLGVNGAGKSTTISMLCTQLLPDSGTAIINGLRLGQDNDRIKGHIGIVFQHNCLDRLLTVRNNLMLRGGLYDPDKNRLRKRLHTLAGILDMEDILDRPFGKLSGGQKRRCELARALMHTPDILFLDEPTTGLDPASRKRVWETIERLRQEMEMTVFLTTHYMEEAAEASHIAIVDKGKLISYGTPFALKEKYAKDKLLLTPRRECEGKAASWLREKHISFYKREERLMIPLEATMSAMPILENIRQMISGFEVIQGTMDDVFLNAAKGQTERRTGGQI